MGIECSMNLYNDLSLHLDLYEINMMYTYWKNNIANKRAIFEYYFRKMPFGNGYAIFNGLTHLLYYINNINFNEDDINFLKLNFHYSNDFLNYLFNFHFECTLRSLPEGSVVFSNEPLVQVEGPLIQAQMLETILLNILNYQILVSTKAARIKHVAKKDLLLEFGTRQAQEMDASIWGARAAYISGFNGTSNIRAGKIFDIPIYGTHAHSLVQAYKDDYKAFKAYANTHYNCVFLIDTFDVFKSGLPAAIKVAKEMGNKISFNGVRIDSGDLAYTSKKIRFILNDAGFYDTKIYASGDLDENVIQSLKEQNSPIDAWGIGTKLITSYDQPALGGVYKLVAIEGDNKKLCDTIKISGTTSKTTIPGKKQIWRIINKKSGKLEGDYITDYNDNVYDKSSIYMFHPNDSYLNKTVTNFIAIPLLLPIVINGNMNYDFLSLDETRSFSKKQLSLLWNEYKRNLNPQYYPVDFSNDLIERKKNCMNLIHSDLSDDYLN